MHRRGAYTLDGQPYTLDGHWKTPWDMEKQKSPVPHGQCTFERVSEGNQECNACAVKKRMHCVPTNVEKKCQP